MISLSMVEFVEVNNVKIAFRKGKDVPLVYIHGSGCDGSLWENQLESLGGYAVDLPGHGMSDDANVKSVYDYAFYVAKATKTLLGRVIFVGHSLGGAIAQEIYLNFKDVVSALVLVGTGARLRVLPEILEGLEKRSEKIVEMLVEMSFASLNESLTSKFKEQFMERIEILLRDLRACDRFDLLNRYRDGEISIEVPTLIVVGEKDRLTPVKYSEFFRSVIPNSELVVINDAGHMVMLEKPEEFNSVLADFVAKFLI